MQKINNIQMIMLRVIKRNKFSSGPLWSGDEREGKAKVAVLFKH